MEYSNNKEAGDQTAVITVKGKGNYTGVLQKKFSIVKKSIAGAKIQIHDKSIYKKGKRIKPRVTVTYQNQTLLAGRDYELSYSNNKKVSKNPGNRDVQWNAAKEIYNLSTKSKSGCNEKEYKGKELGER